MKRLEQLTAHPLYQYHQQRIEEAEEDRIFCRHGLEHALDVARIMYIQVLEKGLSYQKDVVYATALLHDIGRYEQYEKGIPHHEAGAVIAENILSECGYDNEAIAMIIKAIRTHQKEEDADAGTLGGILYRADKSSRNCFRCKAGEDCYWPHEKKNRRIVC